MNNRTGIFFRNLWYWVCKYVLIVIPDKWFYQIITFINYNRLGFKWYHLNLVTPKTFNEKLNYLKMNDRNELASVVADKVAVRDYVSNTIGANYLTPLIGVYDNAKEIDYDELPCKFALKTNHGSGGWNLICNDKSKLIWPDEVKKLNSWLRKNAYYLSREWHYKNIIPKLLCESLLEYEIMDYKFFCSQGNPQYIQVDRKRFSSHERSLFTTEWVETNVLIRYNKISNEIPKPVLLDEMLMLSEKLSSPFHFCRVDLYEHNNRVYFGEITIHPGGGMEPFVRFEDDLKMGEVIDIKTLKKSRFENI